MPRLNPRQSFEPSRSTKWWWRYTRKSSTLHGDVTLPGLFQTAQFKFDFAAIVVIIFGELVGLANLLAVGQMTLLFTAGLFLADLLFAIGLHFPKGPINFAENKRMVDVEDEKARWDRLIMKWKLVSVFFALLILCVALFKTVSFYVLQGGVFNGLTLAIVLSYAIVALLHISSTGYFLSEALLTSLIRWNRNAFLSQNEKRSEPCTITDYRKYRFQSDEALEAASTVAASTPTHNRMHKLYKEEGSTNTYILETFGILDDYQLQDLIMQQHNDKQESILAIEGLRHQLDILQSDPFRGTHAPPPDTHSGVVPANDMQPADVVVPTTENGR